MMSFAHCLRLDVERSATRNVGCAPRPFGTKGYRGSVLSGPGTPGTAFSSPPFPCCQPTSFDEKSGGDAAGCAAPAASVAAATPPARNPVLNAFLNIVILLHFEDRLARSFVGAHAGSKVRCAGL